MRVREVPGVDLGPAVEQQGRHDQEDPAQHQPGRPGVRAVETGRPAFLLRLVAQPDDRERDQPGQDQHREQVLQEPQRERVPDPGDGEAAGEQVTVGLDDREDQNNEAPEHDEVRQPGDRPLEQLPLPEHLGRLHLGVPLRMRTNGRDPLRRRLPDKPKRPSHHSRRPASTAAAAVMTRPRTILRTTGDLLVLRWLISVRCPPSPASAGDLMTRRPASYSLVTFRLGGTSCGQILTSDINNLPSGGSNTLDRPVIGVICKTFWVPRPTRLTAGTAWPNGRLA